MLSGGDDADRFYFGDLQRGSTDVDEVANFTGGEDVLVFTKAVFSLKNKDGVLLETALAAKLSGNAEDKADRIIYEIDTDEIYYDGNGSEMGKSVLIAKLDPDLDIAATDFLVV